VSQFVFHSPNAVRSLALAAFASIVALLPQVLGKIEYRANESGVGMRSHGKKDRQSFRKVFDWGELTHAVPVKHGFRYFKKLDEKSALRRFVKMQFSDWHSGEIHVEADDRDRVLGLLTDRDISNRHRL
jgi:hypothetical protein